MENNKENLTPEQEQEKYVPRPQRHVNMARLGLVLFILFVIWQIAQIAMGGM